MQGQRVFMLLAAMAIAPLAQAADPIEGLARTCNNCHGVNGVSAGGSMPSIGGLPESYLKGIMMEWKQGFRSAATMNRLVGGLSDEEIEGLAKYFASKPWIPQPQPMSAADLAKGKEITDSCSNCHGDTGKGDEDTPHLNGQQAKYMELELMKYRNDGFTMPNKKMARAARKLSDAEVELAARYYGAQGK
jgi:sulfide dehydrogenase cytochrome subunit